MIGITSEEELMQIGRYKEGKDFEKTATSINYNYEANNNNFKALNEENNFEVTELNEEYYNEDNTSMFFPTRANILKPNEYIKFQAWSEDPEGIVFAFRCCGKPFNIMRCECIQSIFGIVMLIWVTYLLIGKLKILIF